jgi:hypothetical protein
MDLSKLHGEFTQICKRATDNTFKMLRDIPIDSLYIQKKEEEVYFIDRYIIFKSGALSNWCPHITKSQSMKGKLTKLTEPINKLDELSELPQLTKRAYDTELINPTKRVRMSKSVEPLKLIEPIKSEEPFKSEEPLKSEEPIKLVKPLPVFYSVTQEFVYLKATLEKFRSDDPQAKENNSKIADEILKCRCPKKLQGLGHRLKINIELWDAESSTILEECMRKKFEQPLYKAILEFVAVNNLRIIEGQPDGGGLYVFPQSPDCKNLKPKRPI